MLPPPLVRLQCGVNSYEWGKVGSASAAAQFAAATPAEGFSVQDGKPYAELWMGTHPSNPSRSVTTGRTLLDLIESNATLLSTSVAERFGKKLPFLFKILSINKALSIQAHPNKKLAERLHARDPAHYPDDNHKPEMAIAITDFEGLCGFRPVAEIAAFLLAVDGFRELVGVDIAEKFIKAVIEAGGELTNDNKDELKGQLKAIFSATMKNSQNGEKLQKVVEVVLSQVRSEKNAFAHNSADERAKQLPVVGGATLVELIERTHREFGVDVGTFMLFFLNYVTLTPGEALFLVADDIHAYISGDIVECMAASDNVVRAGFTPKFKDVDTLINMLTYNTAPIEEQKMVPTPYAYSTMNAKGYSSGSTVMEYNPPIDEFSVAQIKLVGSGAKVTMERIAGPSILIATSGKGSISVGTEKEEVDTGYVFFVGADAECVVEANVGDDEEFIVYRAFCEVEDKKEQEQE